MIRPSVPFETVEEEEGRREKESVFSAGKTRGKAIRSADLIIIEYSLLSSIKQISTGNVL